MTAKFKVFVDDNAHPMDKDERHLKGEYDTVEEATQICEKIVDDSLMEQYRTGMTAEELYQLYIDYGEDPFIFTGEGKNLFSAWDYAKKRSGEICGKDQEP